MADEPRSIPIHPSLHRPEQVMGGEREPVMCAALLSIITGPRLYSRLASNRVSTIPDISRSCWL